MPTVCAPAFVLVLPAPLGALAHTRLELNRLHWWYWSASLLLIVTGLTGQGMAFTAVIALAAVQVVHYRVLKGSFGALAVQVRLAALVLFTAALIVPGLFAAAAVGLTARCLLAYCFMARVLMLLPFNRTGQALDRAYVARVFLEPPSTGAQPSPSRP